MFTTQPELIQTAALLAMLAAATVSDLHRHRIGNRLTFGGAVLALILAGLLHGFPGLLTAVAGLGAGLLIYMPGYALGGTAAGDVKLLAAAGAFAGPVGAFWIGAFGLVAGAILALVLLTVKGGLGTYLHRMSRTALVYTSLRTWAYAPPGVDEVASQRFPFALALLTGCCAWLIAGHSGLLG